MVSKQCNSWTCQRAVSRTCQRALKEHYRAACDFWHSKEVQEYIADLQRKAILFIGTSGFKLKTDAKASRTLPAGVFANKQEVIHACDEMDMLEIWASIAMTCGGRNLLTAWDQAQEIATSRPANQGHRGDETVRSSKLAEWMSGIAVEHKMQKTSRFGNVIVDLLHAMFSDYANLQARHDAPRTTLEAYNVPEVQWEPLGHAAGGLGNWKVFAVIGAVVVRELRAKRSVIVTCIYAAFREIVASFLTHVVEIKFGQETSSAASNGPVKIEVAKNKKRGPRSLF